MGAKTVQFFSLLFTSLILGAGLAHLLELPNKIDLPRDDYLTVQQIYRGWALLGIVLAAALLSTLALAIMVRDDPRVFRLTLIAFACIAASLVVFFVFTFPTNQQTNNWTVLPANWEQLRRRWEYSHAASAVLYLIALISLILAALTRDRVTA